jgi:ABC-type dipeptide/oligopeptide/nickel transport system ATPase component
VSFPFPAVNGLNLEADKGAFTSIVGESGSGKSVTALALCRLLPPAARVEGEVLFKGQNLLHLSEGDLLRVRGKEIAYVFQDPSASFDPVLRVGAQIVEARRAHFRETESAASAKALEFLRAARVADAGRIFAAYPHELSGGLKQRAMIAMALSMEPQLLVADEPTTALDVTTQAEILALLKSLQRERGLSLLFITHDLALAARFSDRIYVMEKGSAVERMEKKDGRFAPASAYARRLFSAELAGTLAPKTPIGEADA